MSKLMKKVLSIVAAIAMVLTMTGIPAFAATGTPQNLGKISITSPADVAATTENTYTIYKIFDATVSGDTAAYKLIYSTAPTGWTAQNGYITAAPESLDATAIANLKQYIEDNNIPVADTVKITGANKTVESTDLQPGYYFITTTTGTAVMVNSNQTTPIKDKNELSTVDKVAGSEYSADAKKAIQAVGNDQPFTVQITKKHGTGHIVFNDTMTNMTYNSDLTVTVGGQTVAAGDTTYSVTPATGNAGLTVTFVDSYIQGLDDDTVITLNYTAKITSDALQTDPAKNSASLTLDNGNTTTTDDVEVYNGKITVTKTDGKNQPLEGAGFKLKNSEGKYYTLTNGVVSFTDNGTEVMADDTDSKNVAVFAGLPAGTYTLEESTVPAGYNKADDQTITITAGDYTAENLSKTATVVNNAGSTLPSTGGMGTTIFYVLGAALVIGAGVVLVTRRKLS